MDAKTLRDEIATKAGAYVVSHPEHRATILRALDLLAAVEGSQDEIVRELTCDRMELVQNGTCAYMSPRPYGLWVQWWRVEKAAAALVAMKAELLENEGVIFVWRRRTTEAEAERDSLKQHAEAMAEWIDEYAPQGIGIPCLDAYRAAHPKEEA